MDRMVRRHAAHRITLIPERLRGPRLSQLRTESRVSARRTTRTPEPMAQPTRGPVQMRSGANPMFRTETSPQPRSITPTHMEQQLRPRDRRAAKRTAPPPRRELLPPAKPPMAICMQGTMAMCTRTRAQAGKNRMATAAGAMSTRPRINRRRNRARRAINSSTQTARRMPRVISNNIRAANLIPNNTRRKVPASIAPPAATLRKASMQTGKAA